MAAVLALLATAVAPAAAGAEGGDGGTTAAGVLIEVLSSRAEYVSGGDARIRVSSGGGDAVSVWVNGDDVTATLDTGPDGSLEGVVDGLRLGPNLVRASAGAAGAEVTVTNHPITGPMFSGPHQVPFFCQTEDAGLGPALDDDCSAPTTTQWLYRTTGGDWAAWPADGSTPDDVAETTTTLGATVDYVVELETGTINRAVYQTAILIDPTTGGTPGWNGRLVYSYGGGCNAAYAQGRGNGGVLSDLHLSRGYGTASSSLNVLNNNCNDVLSAETTSMVKEHFIEHYGDVVHTIGWGGSGGAISQYLISHNYPGLLDGIIPTYNYPDATSIFPGIGDCRLLYNYALTAPAGMWDDAALGAISGYHDWTNCLAWEFSFTNRYDATAACNPIVPPEIIYDPVTNPTGIRCTTADDQINILGIDPATGFAPAAADNIGVQYGLGSLNDGDISVEQFLDLNANIGGFDGDGLVVGTRSVGSDLIDRFYSTGRITTGAGLATVPMINVRPYLDEVTDIHTRFYTFAVRDRLLRDNGTAANQIVQIYPIDAPPAITAQIYVDALSSMDEWLANIATDTRHRTADEVIAAKPEGLADTCWDHEGNPIVEPAVWMGDTACNDLMPSFGDPRIEAGAPLSTDILKCELTAPDRGDYDVEFSDEQWAELEAIFADGVCDYSRPGVDQVAFAGTWAVYGPTCMGLAATIVGTDGADGLFGTAGDDVIVAGAGNDRVYARGGDDVICGGDGDDVLRGNEGDDIVLGEIGHDRLLGGTGDDHMYGGIGADRLFGREGDDHLDGGRGADLLDGDSGYDTCDGGPWIDVIRPTCEVAIDEP